MDFPKKWLIVSFLAHVVILWASGYIFFSIRQPSSHIPVDFQYFKITESEPPPVVPPTVSTPPITAEPSIIEEPENITPLPAAREKFKITPPPLPELPPDFMMEKEKVDSTAIKKENLKRIYMENMIVPYEVDIFAVLDMSPVEIRPTREDTLRMIINNLSLHLDRQDVEILNDIVGDRYYSRHSNPTVPVDAILKKGFSWLSGFISSKFSSKTIPGADRFLTFDDINVMKLLWQLKSATPGQVYSQIPQYIILPMSDVVMILEQLTKKGIVKKDEVKSEDVYSPLEQLLKRGSLNKDTGEYEAVYTPIVSREELLEFHLAQYSNVKLLTGSEGSYGDAYEILETIEKKLIMLSTEEIKK
ncbi:hypothetical protein AMJ80_01435 [bacterium SM23_31]|nr:MAG: hypothetical protein AMJ80_01435 [bacterium SM23_31]